MEAFTTLPIEEKASDKLQRTGITAQSDQPISTQPAQAITCVVKNVRETIVNMDDTPTGEDTLAHGDKAVFIIVKADDTRESLKAKLIKALRKQRLHCPATNIIYFEDIPAEVEKALVALKVPTVDSKTEAPEIA